MADKGGRLIVEALLHDSAAGVDEDHAIPAKPLEDEALAPEEPRPGPLVESNAQLRTRRGAQESVLLTDQLALRLIQVDGDDLARVG